ncbi:hypothetical protein MTO96_046389, partial [Rhipicephalus appendiculatus]
MGSRSTLEPEEDYGSFTDEYSVRIEVYETEVTDSGGSAPIIKISGLCNADDPMPYLMGQQSERRFEGVDQAANVQCHARVQGPTSQIPILTSAAQWSRRWSAPQKQNHPLFKMVRP